MIVIEKDGIYMKRKRCGCIVKSYDGTIKKDYKNYKAAYNYYRKLIAQDIF